MSKKKIVTISILSFIGLIALVFILELLELGFFGFFEPKRENIKREIFENTKSYIHGKIQDLALRYGEHQTAETQNDKEIIENMIKMQFTTFDESKIENEKLKDFLIKIRGY